MESRSLRLGSTLAVLVLVALAAASLLVLADPLSSPASVNASPQLQAAPAARYPGEDGDSLVVHTASREQGSPAPVLPALVPSGATSPVPLNHTFDAPSFDMPGLIANGDFEEEAYVAGSVDEGTMPLNYDLEADLAG